MHQTDSTLKSQLAVLIFATQALSCANLDQLEPTGDGQKAPVVQNSGNAVSSNGRCTMDAVRYPTDVQDFQDLLYGNRGFLTVYNNVKHLGHDIVYAEGTAIHPIGCGIIKFYGPATGYGTLVAVVEHRLATALSATNGDGTDTVYDTFLSIYGHLRRTAQVSGGDELAWQVGDTVQATDTIGYVQDDSLNGDGPEHLHLGIRLQSAADAKAADSAWFRGNDTPGEGEYKKYYTDPKVFIPNLDYYLNGNEFGDGEPDGTALATHHPIGTLLHDVSGADYYLVVDTDKILDVSGYKHLPWGCAVGISSQTLDCYTQAQFDPFSLYLDAKVVKFDGEPQVYQLYPGNGFAPTGYRTFLSYDSFLSWGYQDSDIMNYPLDQKLSVLGSLQDNGFVGMMPGALVKGQGQSEVAVADQKDQRRPIFNWDVFQDLGYKQDCIYEIDPTTLDTVAGTRSSQTIDVTEVMSCGSQSGYVCVPGATQPCGCGDGSAGNQTCQDDGQGFGACDCPVQPDAGMDSGAAAGGSGGSGGSGQSPGADSGTGGTSNTSTGGHGGSGGTDAGIEPCGGHCAIGTVCINNQCVLADAGAGGSGGGQNTGGDGGSGGSGGSSQDAGMGGTSGSAGTGGTGTSSTGGTGGTSNTGGNGNSPDAGNPTGPCATQGVPGKTTFIIDAPVTSSNGISVYGWIHYPNWSGVPDVPWSGWAWGAPGVSQISFQEGDAYQGAKYIFAPGLSPGAGQDQTAWYCEQNDCPIGTFIVCEGQQEACRFQNGVLSGGASCTPNSANWQNMQCILP